MGQALQFGETVGYNPGEFGEYFDFHVNNMFYTLAPAYYMPFYSIYLNKCLSVYQGYVRGFHSVGEGVVPQKALQCLAKGFNNMLFANPCDFNGDPNDYAFVKKWAKKTKFFKAIKKGHLYDIALGTSLLKINRKGNELYVTAHRMDTFFVDVAPDGTVCSAKIYFDAMTNTNAFNGENHYGLCEERYFNEEGKACVRTSVYMSSSGVQNSVADRSNNRSEVGGHKVNWDNLPKDVRLWIKNNHPEIIVDREILLPFHNTLGCYLFTFTEDIPQVPDMPFGQPIGDILWTESMQYDQIKWFEANEVYMARARALIPEEMWNKDDPAYDQTALSERFYQKVSSMSDDDKVTPIQFQLRGADIKTQKENIFKDMAFKMNVSASTIASFLSEGNSAKTATEIMSERTKSDGWINSQINLIKPVIDEMLKTIMLYYDRGEVEIIIKGEDQSPFNEKLKTNSDVFAAGNMSPRMFVKLTYKNMSLKEQEAEIEYLESTRNLNVKQQESMMNSWNK